MPAEPWRVRAILRFTSDIELELRFWTDSRRTDLLAASSDVRRRVLDAFRQAGIGLPEPDVRRVRMEVAAPED